MSTFLTWFPRILSMVYVLFVASFALDSFAGAGGFWRHLGILVLHLTPAFAVAICLWVAWRWRILGGLLHMVLSMIFTVFFWLVAGHAQSFLMISLPLVVAGLFFILSKWNYRPDDGGHAVDSH